MDNMEERKVEVKRYEKNGRSPSWIVKRYGKYRWNASWIVKRYEKNGRNPSWIVKRYRKYRWKVSWRVKNMDNMEEKEIEKWKNTKNMEEN